MLYELSATCSPEAAGIPSSAIDSYLRALRDARLEMHNVLISRNGKLCFEAYWKPFSPDFRHRLYSCSKSFVSVAVGMLIERGLLSLEDSAIGFFSDKAPAQINPWLSEMTVRDLLRMATCYEYGGSAGPEDADWESTFFTSPVTHKPGQVFSYCTTATTMLCMIIKRVSGEEFMGVLRPIFDALGISRDAFCVESPCGHEWGGSGVCLTPREFLKFADLITHYGKYNGAQLLPEGYLREATSRQIDNYVTKYSPDSGAGYGYQFWMLREGGFAMHGMGGQYALCLPNKRLTLITNGYDELNDRARDLIFSAFWRDIAPNISPAPLAEDDCARARLERTVNSLELPLPIGEIHSLIEARVHGVNYTLDENKLGMRALRFEFDGDAGVLYYENAYGAHSLKFGLGAYIKQPFPETRYFGRRIGVSARRGYTSYVSAAWSMPDSLTLNCHIADVHLGNLRIVFAFDGDTVTLYGRKHAEWFLDEYMGFASGRAMD